MITHSSEYAVTSLIPTECRHSATDAHPVFTHWEYHPTVDPRYICMAVGERVVDLSEVEHYHFKRDFLSRGYQGIAMLGGWTIGLAGRTDPDGMTLGHEHAREQLRFTSIEFGEFLSEVYGLVPENSIGRFAEIDAEWAILNGYGR